MQYQETSRLEPKQTQASNAQGSKFVTPGKIVKMDNHSQLQNGES
jgi:hypothetical protein